MNNDKFDYSEYIGESGTDFNLNCTQAGLWSIPVLEFLNGIVFDDVALCYISALKPTKLRITYKTQFVSNFEEGRITVTLKKNNRILFIEKEVYIDLPSNIKNSFQLDKLLHRKKMD